VDLQKDEQKHENAPSVGSVQTIRSERTRAALLAAAESIFARDGFEASRIEDIAAAAGRSRGAFYANFASKTEVFLALRNLAITRRARRMRELLEPLEGEDERYAALMKYILSQICDTPTLMLEMEFKLFALRHPGMLQELSEKHLDAATTVNQQELGDLFADHEKKTIEEMRWTTLAIEALLEGFALNALFCPTVLTQERLEALVPKLLDTIFGRMDADRSERGVQPMFNLSSHSVPK
jgi:AcrR family transcriptional regulator